MFSELKHSKKLSKRFQRDPKFKAVIYKRKDIYIDMEPGLKEAKCWEDIESVFSNISNYDSEEDINGIFESEEVMERSEIDSFIRYYRK